MLARRARTPTSWEHVLNFRTCDVAVSSLITYNRADASTCATRRRAFGAAGPSRTNYALYSNDFSQAAVWVPVFGASGTANTVTFPGVDTARLEQSTLPAVAGDSWVFSVKVSGTGTIRLVLDSNFGTGGGNEQLITLTATPTTHVLPHTFTSGATGNVRMMILERSDTTATSVTISEANLKRGLEFTPHIPTTSAAVTTTDWPRTNYIGQSKKFTDALWGLAAAGTGLLPTIVSEVVPSPSGSLDATRITFNQGAGDTLGDESAIYYYQAASLTTGAPYCAGIWARIPLGVTISVRSVAASGYMAMVGTGQWKRYSRPETAASAFAYCVIGLRGGLGIGQSTGRVTVDLWHCTLEDGSELTATIPNDTSAPLTVTTPPYGQMVTVPANVPILEYDADGIGRGMRVEKESRNLAARSGFLDTIDDPAKVLAEPGFPDSSGGYNAFRIRAVDSSGIVFAQQVVPTSGELVAQIVLKRGNSDAGGNGYGFYNVTTAADLAYAFINYATGAVTKSGPLAASLTATAVPYGDDLDWWLLTLKLAAGFSASDVLNFHMGYLGSSATIGQYHYIDWVQVEPGLLPTSYIKPVSAGTVPVRDAASAVINDLSSLALDGASGTVLVEFEMPATSQSCGAFSLTTTGAVWQGVYTNSAQVIVQAYEAGVIYGHVFAGFSPGDTVRAALSFGPGYFASAVNGAAGLVQASGTPITATKALVGDLTDDGIYHLNSLIAEVRTTSRTLSIAELVRETTL